MAQLTKEELDALHNEQDNDVNHMNQNEDATHIHTKTNTFNNHYGCSLTEDELKSHVKELNDLMDPSKLTTTQQTCIAQIVACFITNHIHRYYHCHKYVATMNNKLNNLNMNQTNPINDTNDNDSEQHNKLHLVYPIPILKPPPNTLFTENKDDGNDEEEESKDIGFTMSSIINKPQYYCSITSTNTNWAKAFLQSFCDYLKVPRTQTIGYLYFLENSWIDPQPFFKTLGWNDKNNLLRIPLLLLQFAISHQGYYDARLRSLLKCIITYCNISWEHEFIIREYSFGIILHVLLEKKQAKSSTKKYGRWAKIGAVGVVSGVIIAVTGGLAAPAVAAGLGAIGLTATGTFLLSTTGTATLYLLFGVTGAGYAGLKMHNTVSEINDFKFISLSCLDDDNKHNGLNVIITINGWLEGIEKEEESVETSNDALSDDGNMESATYWRDIMIENGDIHLRSDCYTLQFEKECLLSLGEGLKKFVAQRAVSGTVWTAAKVGVGYTAFATLITALTWPVTLLSVAHYIDNPWSVAFSKSKEAGLVLADCLASGNHGRRPVTLIGYSLGARVIYYALKELVRKYNDEDAEEEEVKQEDENASKFSRFMKKRKNKKKTKEEKMDLSSIIENVVILGGPLSCNAEQWKGIRKIVSDRIINCYSVNDWVLKFVYRTATATQSVAGLMPIQCDGVENVNLSGCIDGHSEYYQKTPKIVQYLIDSCGLHL
eukprot:1007117_1